jgi:hypothetical protein
MHNESPINSCNFGDVKDGTHTPWPVENSVLKAKEGCAT